MTQIKEAFEKYDKCSRLTGVERVNGKNIDLAGLSQLYSIYTVMR
jgi:hypothetical protein